MCDSSSALRKRFSRKKFIIAFHAEFEYIHPFQDGNGRVGRLVALKECLRHNIIPFFIEDSKKNYYYRGLKEWRNEKGWLIDTCLDGQDTFVKLLDILEIEHELERECNRVDLLANEDIMNVSDAVQGIFEYD